MEVGGRRLEAGGGGVVHLGEEEALGRHADAGGAAVFLLDDSAQAVEGELAATHVEQCAGDRPHHVAQESVAADGEHQLVGSVQ